MATQEEEEEEEEREKVSDGDWGARAREGVIYGEN
eukprot:CAMPEP_0197579538 /NCGR_PEP_ID=MMETSP1326-20131121/3532_1 /TAXON_ID=1155430 /ORGANISM="Genus nov. species nov., Strain RCC2288" /LENGTH=34 /DNA_ID= /DNA_START= /DNA_END= /DNA_ORIENTATION=